MSLRNGIMRFITRISKFSCCLYSVKIFCIRSDSVLKSRLFFAKWCHFCCRKTFKQKTAVWNMRSHSQFHFLETRMEKFLHLTLAMKCHFVATSRVLFRIGRATIDPEPKIRTTEEKLILLPKKKTIVSVYTTNVRSYVCLFISRNHLFQPGPALASAGSDWKHFWGACGSPLPKEKNHYTFRIIPQEHWSIAPSMERPS